MRIEIYLDDLAPAKQAEILSVMVDNCNYDVFPICTINSEGDDENVCCD